MNINVKNITTGTLVAAAMVVGTLSTTAPANATHQIGHAIVGGVIGGIIGGAILNGVQRRRQPIYVQPRQPVYNSLPQSHYNWCFNKYRSYDQGSNTYQPYNAPRTYCRSPWWR